MTKDNNERYHDRIAGRYDEIYEDDPYHQLCRELTFRHLKPHLPRDLSGRVLDAGCGTGVFGLRLAKSGYKVDFLDISQKMIEQARARAEEARLCADAKWVHADLTEPGDLEPGAYSLIVAQGDLFSFVADPGKTLRAAARLLRQDGVLAASVDQRLAGLDFFAERDDLGALERFVQDGKSEWLGARREERFATRMFLAEELRDLVEKNGFTMQGVMGRTVLPLKRWREKLADAAMRRRVIEIEERLNKKPSALGRASHLDFIAKRV